MPNYTRAGYIRDGEAKEVNIGVEDAMAYRLVANAKELIGNDYTSNNPEYNRAIYELLGLTLSIDPENVQLLLEASY